MSEPEDLIIDGAHMALRLVHTVWRRHSPPDNGSMLPLSDVRLRIELFLNALLGLPLPVVAAEPPAPMSWLARLARRGPAHMLASELCAGTDGVHISVPPAVDASAGMQAAIEIYLLFAFQQAARLMRGSTAIALGIEANEIRDRFMLADACAVDRRIAREAPGLLPGLISARRHALAARGGPSSMSAREHAVECRLRELLERDPRVPPGDLPADGTAAQALAWARASAGAQRSTGLYRGIVPPLYWGRPIRPSAANPGGHPTGDEQHTDTQPLTRQRVAEMRRRPRVRNAEEDESDEGFGTWVIRADEPQESVEDPFGLQRPTDRSDEADPEGLGDSLSELPEARIVRTPGRPREVLRAGEQRPRAAGAQPAAPKRVGIAYPEWDFQRGAYRRPGAIVRPSVPLLGDLNWAEAALTRHAGLVRRVRTRFERLRPRRARVDRQPDGPELDIAAYVTTAADVRAGATGEDRLYLAMRAARRELSVALLVDVSASTDSWVSGQQRIIDVEKEALLVVCEAMDALGDRHAIFAFSGEGPEDITVTPVKGFSEHTHASVRRRIAALESDRYTRVGAAMRHATAALAGERTRRRLLLLLSDGKPNDIDAYEGQYGIEDARQAVAESRAQDVHVFCLTVDREAPRYASRIFGPGGFAVLRRADQLPAVLIEVLRRLIRG